MRGSGNSTPCFDVTVAGHLLMTVSAELRATLPNRQ
jgi:hypothetical protein